MEGDVLAAAAPRVARARWNRRPSQRAGHDPSSARPQLRFVADAEFEQRRQVGARPVAVAVGRRQADVALQQQPRQRAPAVQHDRGLRPGGAPQAFDALAVRQLDAEATRTARCAAAAPSSCSGQPASDAQRRARLRPDAALRVERLSSDGRWRLEECSWSCGLTIGDRLGRRGRARAAGERP